MKRYVFIVVSILVSLTLSAQSGQSSGAPVNVEAVDLGLPSGTKWANMNVGASSPEEYGTYFAWGETLGKNSYTWDNYMCPEMTCGKPGDAVFDLVGDIADIAGTKFDAAKMNWGASWNMPTAKQVEELASNCYFSLVTINGVQCRKLTSRINGNEIIFPLAGARWFEDFAYEGSLCYYWASTLRQGGYVSPGRLIVEDDRHGWGWSMGGENDRFCGFPIRPVFVESTQDNPPKFMVDYNNESESVTVNQSGIGFVQSSDGTSYSLSTDGKYHSQYDLSKIKYINRYYEPTLLMSTSEIDFGIVEIGVTKTYPLSVTNKGVFPEYIHATCQGDFFIAPEDQNFLLEAGQSLTFDVSYTPTREMASNGSVALTSSAMRGGSENVILHGVGTDFDPQAHMFADVLPNSADNAETLLCDTLNGKYTVSYEGEVPDVKEGNVVFVDNDSTTYIILVTSVTRDGNVVSFDGKRGDLSYVFHDISFTLSTAADEVIITRLNGMETSKRMKLGSPKRVRDTKRLFDKKKTFDIPIVKKGDAKFSLAGSFHPTLDCEMYFEFYEPIHDVFEGYAFTKAGLFRSGVKFIGELKTECNLSVNVKKKSEKYEYDEKEPKLIKENFLPKKNWDFVVFGVPVRVSFGCDLFEKAYMYCKGEFEMYQGFVSTITGTYGFSYDPNDYFNGYVPIKDVDIQFERTDPTVKGKLEAGLKAYLIPRFYARIYDLVGPCVELKPYFDLNLGGAFQEEFFDASENGSDTDYISTYLNASFGVDWGLGFSVLDEIECKKFADKTWDMGKTFIDPVYLLKSPSDLNLVSESTKKVRKGKPIDLTFDAQCKFLWGSYSSPFFPVIKIDIPKRNFHTYLFTYGNGKANYKWIPQTDDEELYAKVYDKDGKAVKTICLPNPEDNSMRALTEKATDVKANSAVLNGKFDSGNTVVIDKMGFIYSSVEQVPKYNEDNCTFVEVNFDDVMDKSCLVKGLNPGTTYYYRAYASNRYGSNYGNVLSFTTEGQSSLQLSTTSLTLAPGSQSTVNITSGSGSYAAVSNATNIATVTVEGSKLIIKGVAKGTATITVKDNQTQERAKIEVTVTASGTSTPGEAIDLGLPSGTKWANCNVGATKPEEYGGYYAWGETEEKEVYDWSTYIHCDGTVGTCHDIGRDISGSKYDVAHVKWGGDWQMPTVNQIRELLENCKIEWTTLNGVKCRKITGPNGNSIFLPAAGRRKQSNLIDIGNVGYYWASMQVTSVDIDAAYIYLDDNQTLLSDIDRVFGLTVRPVMNTQQPTVQTETITIPGTNVSFKMVGVEGGTFWMGADDDDDEAHDTEKPRHQVKLSSFAIGETEVTQVLWEAVMGSNPSYNKGTYHPVERVSWDECQTFISKLNNLTGRNFRLPTEAEWEYAARGGKKAKGYKYAGSNAIDAVGWYDLHAYVLQGIVDHETQPVAQLQANELGLYDMSGNVREWCQDYYSSNYYSSSPSVDPCNSIEDNSHVDRGGDFINGARNCRVVSRNGSYHGAEYRNLGLRLALSDGGSSPQAYLSCPDNHHPHLIDLGLPSGTKWACCNVGADKPEAYGGYYAWGETEIKDNYEWWNYKWCDGDYDKLNKYCIHKKYGIVDNKTTLEPEDDVATVKWGGDWRMPTSKEISELSEKCKIEIIIKGNRYDYWETQTSEEKDGYLFIGSNGNCIFLPAAGYKGWGFNPLETGSYCQIWSSNLYVEEYTHSPSYSWSDGACFGGWGEDKDGGGAYWNGYTYRDYGKSVRPVMNPNGKPDYEDGGNPSDGDGRPDTPGPDADDQGDL